MWRHVRRHLIELVPYDAKHLVQCSSKDKGKDVMKACSVGCIGCHLCEKNCPSDAVHVIDNVAYIDTDKVYRLWRMCAEVPEEDYFIVKIGKRKRGMHESAFLFCITAM